MSKNSKTLKEYQQEWVGKGLCKRCGGRPHAAGKKLCQICLDKTSKRRKARRKRLIAASVCPQCGTRKPEKSYTWCKQCLKKQNGYLKAHRAKKRRNGQCQCGRRLTAAKANCEYCLQKQRERNRKLRQQVYDAYGGAICACCGETQWEFLQLDHVNNDGAEHRRRIGKSGMSVFKWIVDNGFPSGFQVLCANCNYAKGYRGGCPHQTRTSKDESKNSTRAG